jgi:hypothetical protein
LLFASIPIALAIFSIFSVSQEEERQEALGKQAEVAPEMESPLAPMGPSVIFTRGILSLGTAVVCQADDPDKIETFSSRVNSPIKDSILSIELAGIKRNLLLCR